MSLTEKDMILRWCSDNYSISKKEEILSTSLDRDSFFCVRKNEHCMEEYDWSTVPELKEKLDKLWKKQYELMNIEKTVLVAAWKERELPSEVPNIKKGCAELPDYVYVF